MTMKNKNPFYGWLTPVLVCLVTLISFLLLRPSDAAAGYWISMAWVMMLEALFFVWAGRGYNREAEHTSQFHVFLGVGALYYIICSAAWMMAYAYFSDHITLNLYIVGILVITVLWVVVASLQGRHDAACHEQQTMLEDNTVKVRALVKEIKGMAEVHGTSENRRAWAALIREAESVIPSQISEHGSRLMAKARELAGTGTQG